MGASASSALGVVNGEGTFHNISAQRLAEPLVIFMFNPFNRTVLVRVLGLLGESLHKCPRDAWLIYFNAWGDDLVRQHTPLREVSASPYHKLY
ncbi:MAG: hypothetical protein ACRD3D_12100 [Terriglobia bacterium]